MKLTKANPEEKETNFFGQIIYKFIPYWPLFLLLLVLSITASWLYLRTTTPMYEANAKILIKDENKGAAEVKGLEDLNLLSTKKIIENEVEVIQSRTLLYEVVNTLGLYAPIFEQGQIKNTPAYITSPIKVLAKNPEEINPVKKVPFTYDGKSKSVAFGGKTYPMQQWVATPYGVLQFVPNSQFVSGTDHALYFSLVTQKDVANDIQNNLKVTTSSKQTSILDLNLKDAVPQRAEDILNALLVAYNKATVKDKNTLAANTLAFVDERLKSVQQSMDSIERRNQQYKARKGAIDIGEQGRLFLQNVSVNDQKLSDVNMQMAVLGQVENYARSKDNEGGIVPSTLGVSDPTLSQLVDKLYSSELEYENLKKTNAENSPKMLALTDRIAKIKPSILENIQSQRRSLEASRNNILATNGSYNAMLQSIPEKERELVDINRGQNIINGIYSFLLQKREETALSRASTVSDSRIVDKAEANSNPVSPKKKVIYLSAMLIAFFLGIGIVTGKETFSRKIMFRHEIEKLTDQPIIGEIVSEQLKDPIVIGEDKKTFIAEQFRKLRSTLSFVGINSTHKRILVTSSISGEGKSFVATNLALSLALTGKKVILLDCDLNNPSLNNKLRIQGEKGITEYLTGEAAPEDIVLETDLDPNLFLIPTGRLPRNPSELIMNGRIEQLLKHLDGQFDYIVVDTAPVSPVTDAYTLSPLCDATLFVVRHGYTPKVFVERIDENNRINQLNNMAIIFNGVQSRGFGSKNYGYGYGYGYIYDEKENKYRIRIGKQ